MVEHIIHDVVHPLLTPSAISGIATAQLQHFSDFVNAIPPEGLETDLYKLATREFATATMHTFYGPLNPASQNPQWIEDFLTWENEVPALMAGIFPQYPARKPYHALRRCALAFEDHITQGRMEDAYEVL